MGKRNSGKKSFPELSSSYVPLPIPKTKNQKLFIDAILKKEMVVATGCAGTGKSYLSAVCAAYLYSLGKIKTIVITRPTIPTGKSIGFFPGPQPLYSSILTPNGYTTMGEITKGSQIITQSGSPTEVLEIYPKGVKSVFSVKTTEDSEVHACEDHLWFTQTNYEKKQGVLGKIRSTKEIQDTLKDKNGRLNHSLPRVEAVDFKPKEELKIPAYVLGVLLGDGCLQKYSTQFTVEDEEIAEKVSYLLRPLGFSVNKTGSVHYTIVDTEVKSKKPKKEHLHSNRIRLWLNELNLKETKSFDKFVPNIYLHASITDRLELLRGLMDTDGTCKTNGEASFTTTSEKLANNICYLVRSLGGKATKKIRNRVGKQSFIQDRVVSSKRISYEFSINLPTKYNPFSLRRKQNRFKTKYIKNEKIKEISYIGEEQVQCILVSDPSHLYVTDNFVVTHNTLQEKMAPWVAPFIKVLEDCLTKGKVELMLKNGQIQVIPFEVIRGSTFDDALVVLDEAQNCTPIEIKAFVTRHGENCTTVINGDITQSDLNGSGPSGLDLIVRMINKNKALKEELAFIEFTEEDVVRSGLCKLWVQAFQNNS